MTSLSPSVGSGRNVLTADLSLDELSFLSNAPVAILCGLSGLTHSVLLQFSVHRALGQQRDSLAIVRHDKHIYHRIAFDTGQRAAVAAPRPATSNLESLVHLLNFLLDGSFSLFLARQVVKHEFKALEQVQREQEAQANILHRSVRYMEKEYIEHEGLYRRQWLQLL